MFTWTTEMINDLRQCSAHSSNLRRLGNIESAVTAEVLWTCFYRKHASVLWVCPDGALDATKISIKENCNRVPEHLRPITTHDTATGLQFEIGSLVKLCEASKVGTTVCGAAYVLVVIDRRVPLDDRVVIVNLVAPTVSSSGGKIIYT